jgi:hypothetical protein
MKTRWLPILGAVLAFAAVNIAAHFWGTKASLLILSVLLLAWWIAYTYAGSLMDRVYNEYLHYDEEMKRDFMARASAEVRAEIEKREQNEKKA